MEKKDVIFTGKDGIVRIVINRPEKRNALNLSVRKKLKEILEQVKQDETIKVLVITGAGQEAYRRG